MKTDSSRHLEIMGIINLTDDSYLPSSRLLKEGEVRVEDVAGRVSSMIREGADIIDFGACSSRPGAVSSGWEEEWRRLEPAIACVAEDFPDIRISVDTWHSEVISRVYDLVASVTSGTAASSRLIVNDISAGEDDPDMLPLAGRLGLTYIAMHKRGTPQTMQDLCDYDDVIAEVRNYFEMFSAKASRCGVKDWILDPGFGFAKTADQNFELLRGLEHLRIARADGSRARILVGVSRKSMIYKTLNISPEESLPATQVLHLKALQNGADLLRVHDVAEAARTVALYRLLR